ncbi:MAG: shikimate dehydrogenase [Nocardioidaceae bacterium]|nr:shikimate dehydrogenase [Nocardioidaceae bacterium]
MALVDGPRRRRCAVLGSPVAHSLSPVLHRAAYRELSLDWDYEAFDVSPALLPAFLTGLSQEWRGLSLTMPLKRAVIDLCDRVESRGRLLGSINTVVFGDDGRRAGHNTDVPGFVYALAAHGIHGLDSAIIIGGGATAASAMAAAAEIGAHHVTVAARSIERVSHLSGLAATLRVEVELVGIDALAELHPADLVISTIPADGQAGIATPVARLGACVFDVIYDPEVTPVLMAASDAGTQAIGGFDLLLHQAARQVELMVGVAQAPLEAMRAAGLRALAQR